MDMVKSQGEEAEKAVKEAHELLNFLEKELTGKKFFGGNTFGFVDVTGIVVALWMPVFLEAAGKEGLVTKDKYPAICTWADNLLACDVFKQNLPQRESLLALFKARYQAK